MHLLYLLIVLTIYVFVITPYTRHIIVWSLAPQAELIGKPAPDFEMELHGWRVKPGFCSRKGGVLWENWCKQKRPRKKEAVNVEEFLTFARVTVDGPNVAKTVKKFVVYLTIYRLNAPNCGAYGAWFRSSNSRALRSHRDMAKNVPRCLKTGRLAEI